MAITWSTAAGTGATKFKVGVEVVAPTTASGASVTVTTNVWVHTKDAVSDSSVSLTMAGNAAPVGTTTVSVSTPSNADWSTKNQVKVATLTQSVTVATALTLTGTATVTGINAAGAGTTRTATSKRVVNPAPQAAAAAPTDCTAVLSGANIAVAWTNHATTPAPYNNLVLERRDNVATAWISRATLSDTVSSYTDTSVSVDRRYEYRVKAVNNAGSTDYATSGLVETVPATPPAPDAKRPALYVVVSWTPNSTIADHYELWHKQDGVLDSTPVTTLSATATSYTHIAATEDYTHQYFLKAVGASLSSPMGLGSPVVPKLAAPLIPTLLGPPGGIYDASKPITLTWLHNSVDGTGQTGFKPRWRQQGTEAWTRPAGLTLSGTRDVNDILCAGHELTLGDIVTFTGTMPTPLVADTQYWAIPISNSRFRVAITEANAMAGISIGLSSAASFSVQTGFIVSNASSYTIAGGTLAPALPWEWTVSTDGRYAGINPSSPYMPVGIFRTGSAPTALLSTPLDGDTIASPHALVAWAFFSPDGASQQWAEVSLWDSDDNLVEIFESDGDWNIYEFEADLTNGATYAVQVQVEDDQGIRSVVYESNFTVEFIGPATPGITLTWDSEDGLVIIDIDNPDDEDAPPATKNKLYRSTAGGAWELIASDLGLNTTVIDYLPTPNAVCTYRVITSAADGSTETYQAAVQCSNTGDWYWLNGGTSFDVIAKVRYDGGVTVRFNRDKVLHEFAGRTRPVEFTGSIRTHTVELAALLTRDAEGYSAQAGLMALADLGGPVYYRDPVGRRLRCSLGEIEMTDDHDLIQFSTTLTEVSQ